VSGGGLLGKARAHPAESLLNRSLQKAFANPGRPERARPPAASGALPGIRPFHKGWTGCTIHPQEVAFNRSAADSRCRGRLPVFGPRRSGQVGRKARERGAFSETVACGWGGAG